MHIQKHKQNTFVFSEIFSVTWLILLWFRTLFLPWQMERGTPSEEEVGSDSACERLRGRKTKIHPKYWVALPVTDHIHAPRGFDRKALWQPLIWADQLHAHTHTTKKTICRFFSHLPVCSFFWTHHCNNDAQVNSPLVFFSPFLSFLKRWHKVWKPKC